MAARFFFVPLSVPSLIPSRFPLSARPVVRPVLSCRRAEASSPRRRIGKQADGVQSSRPVRRPVLPVWGVVRGVEGSFSRGCVRGSIRTLCGSYGLYGGRGGALAISVRRRMSWRFVSSSLLSPFRAPFRLARRLSHRMRRDDGALAIGTVRRDAWREAWRGEDGRSAGSRTGSGAGQEMSR